MARATTTDILFQDEDYITASLDDGGVRIGLKGFGPFFDIPRGHAWFDRVAEADYRGIVESLHDELSAAYA